MSYVACYKRCAAWHVLYVIWPTPCVICYYCLLDVAFAMIHDMCWLRCVIRYVLYCICYMLYGMECMIDVVCQMARFIWGILDFL